MAALNRTNTSLPQKLGLAAIGLFLAILVLEAALRLGGFIILSLQEHKNAASLRQKGAYRIMCIGESTTQGEYPAFLAQALDGRHLGLRFSVIDRGLDGALTSALLERLEADLDAYHPDMVVAMMGINDSGWYVPFEPDASSRAVRLIRSLRTYKLARIAGRRIAGLARPVGLVSLDAGTRRREVKGASDRSPGNGQDDGGMVESYWPEGKFAEAEAAARKALQINPRNDRAYVYLGWTHIAQGKTVRGKAPQARGEFAAAAVAFKRALEINPRSDEAYRGMGMADEVQGRYATAAYACKKALGINPGSDANHMALGRIYRDMDMTGAAAAAFKKALEINPGNDEAFRELAQLYLSLSGSPDSQKGLLAKPILQELAGKYAVLKLNGNPTDRVCALLSLQYAAMGDTRLAKQYQDQAEEFRLREYCPPLADDYRRLKFVLDQRGVRLVCVQYPMRRLEPLRKLLQGHTDGIVFVDNEMVFKDAVSKGSLAQYFRDMFAGDFGHCTDQGNRLLADNIAAVLAQEVFGK